MKEQTLTLTRLGKDVEITLIDQWAGVDKDGRIYDRNMPYFWQERGADRVWSNKNELQKR